MAQKPPRFDWMRDNIWQFIGVIVSVVGVVVAIYFGIFTLPQWASIRPDTGQVSQRVPSATAAPTATTIPTPSSQQNNSPTPQTTKQGEPTTSSDVAWGTARAITCDDLFNPSSTTNTANCGPSGDNQTTLSFNILSGQVGYPEMDVIQGSGPSGAVYKVAVHMDLSNAQQAAGCIVMDTLPNINVGEVVCIHSNGLVEVLNGSTMSKGSIIQHLPGGGTVTFSDPTNVSVIVERVNSKLFINVADQVVSSVVSSARGNIGFMLYGDQGSVKVTSIGLSTPA